MHSKQACPDGSGRLPLLADWNLFKWSLPATTLPPRRSESLSSISLSLLRAASRLLVDKDCVGTVRKTGSAEVVADAVAPASRLDGSGTKRHHEVALEVPEVDRLGQRRRRCHGRLTCTRRSQLSRLAVELWKKWLVARTLGHALGGPWRRGRPERPRRCRR